MKEPTVVVVFGLPGSGKTYFASRLAERLNATYLNSDIIRNQVLKEKTYTDAEKANIYRVMRMEMELALKAGKSVVVDATFYREILRNKIIASAGAFGADVDFIEIIADEELIMERLDNPREYSEADYYVYLKIREVFEPLQEDHLAIKSGRGNVSSMLDEAMEYLSHQAVNNHD